ncbi:1,2-phenylacetyl-CoA epoxidase subunit PaaD [Priestia megaterium]|uniref:1,2-phenylacetyl-CoA epoxidase subunit PaaD n=1 Tax=Priestia megaterium TaxID=1404 RepID=UPI001129368E|nr:1,2-phenylacetyl-CoA epoxidase subunit PaaD [Priestia megaterium]TPF18415.1 phenylacetate-CoA oxygenase subunit PaaJ [Priestia megaterium]TPF22525.1 phenylacetate-CoA oxygenase subunit PaaJ [Priestia megaterium]
MKFSTKEIKQQVITLLERVKDPEINTVSIIDLGMVDKVTVDNTSIEINVLPTFSGCPALEIIRQNIVNEVSNLYTNFQVKVVFVYSPPWTSDRITEQGKKGLKEFGIAPPPNYIQENGAWHINCPYCDSTYITMENLFGPTACRSILYCKDCKNPFEAMKPMLIQN